MPRNQRIRWGSLTIGLVLAAGLSLFGASAQKKAVDWVTLNPGFKDATFVKNAETCKSCHADAMHGYVGTVHARAFAARPPAEAGDCESCHGPRGHGEEE